MSSVVDSSRLAGSGGVSRLQVGWLAAVPWRALLGGTPALRHLSPQPLAILWALGNPDTVEPKPILPGLTAQSLQTGAAFRSARRETIFSCVPRDHITSFNGIPTTPGRANAVNPGDKSIPEPIVIPIIPIDSRRHNVCRSERVRCLAQGRRPRAGPGTP